MRKCLLPRQLSSPMSCITGSMNFDAPQPLHLANSTKHLRCSSFPLETTKQRGRRESRGSSKREFKQQDDDADDLLQLSLLKQKNSHIQSMAQPNKKPSANHTKLKKSTLEGKYDTIETACFRHRQSTTAANNTIPLQNEDRLNAE